MGNRIMLTKPIFEWLIEHLVFIEENKDELVNFYYPDLPIEQENMKKFFAGYIKKIEAELEKIEIVNSIDKFRYTDRLNEFSFVIIGSQVDVIDLYDKTSTSLRLIHPVEQSKRKNEITYLSTLGRSLLLKEVGSEVVINNASALQRYRVKSIKLL